MRTIRERSWIGRAVGRGRFGLTLLFAIPLLGVTAASASAGPLDRTVNVPSGGSTAVQGAVDAAGKTAAPTDVTKSVPPPPDVTKAAPPPPDVTKSVPPPPDVTKAAPPPPDTTKLLPPAGETISKPVQTLVSKATGALPPVGGGGESGPPAIPAPDLGKTVDRVGQAVDTKIGAVENTLQSAVPGVLPPIDPPGTSGGPPGLPAAPALVAGTVGGSVPPTTGGVLQAAGLTPVRGVASAAPLPPLAVRPPILLTPASVPTNSTSIVTLPIGQGGPPAPPTGGVQVGGGSPGAAQPLDTQPAQSATFDSIVLPMTEAPQAGVAGVPTVQPPSVGVRGALPSATVGISIVPSPRLPQDPRAPGLPGLASGSASAALSFGLVTALIALLSGLTRRWTLVRRLDWDAARPRRFVLLLERPG